VNRRIQNINYENNFKLLILTFDTEQYLIYYHFKI